MFLATENVISGLIYQLVNIKEGWGWKMIASCFIVAINKCFTFLASFFGMVHEEYANVLNGDVRLLYVFFFLMVIDIILGVYRSIRQKTFSSTVFAKGMGKFPLYAVYIGLIGLVCYAWTLLKIPYLDYFFEFAMAYFIAVEARSIILNLEKLGINIPPLVYFLVHGSVKKIENAVKEMFGCDTIEKEQATPKDVEEEK